MNLTIKNPAVCSGCISMGAKNGGLYGGGARGAQNIIRIRYVPLGFGALGLKEWDLSLGVLCSVEV
jgi:hypothetical protein